MPTLDVWITRPGDACYVDDSAWSVVLYDCHSEIYKWADITFANGPTTHHMDAPKAHWTGRVPPGTYVVRAQNMDTGVWTDHAIVAVECDGMACARLYVPGQEKPHPCRISIKEVTGVGEKVAASVQVSGTATNCTQIEVSIVCATGKAQTTVVTVPPSGNWTATLDTRELRCICGKPASVVARCLEHRDCADKAEIQKLKCSPRG